MQLYRAYQLEGGNEAWTPCFDNADFDSLKPTFITVLACDTLIAKDSPKVLIEGAKYLGPMYFDLDSAELSEAIAGAKALWGKLKALELAPTDVEVYLSGKKGLHILIPPVVFMEKQTPVSKLPAIYKELAFNLAVDTVDFAVYSARRGRMFRTHYNVRENGNYKVQISTAELEALTEEGYDALCQSGRGLLTQTPAFCPRLAILYDGIKQKVLALQKKKAKPVDAATLRKHLPVIQQLMRGERVKDGVGFNKIAIQLGIYAQEAKLSEDQLIEQCQGLIQNHTGDGYRYNSPFKREEELRRMFNYLEENCSYDYAIAPIQAMLGGADTKVTAADFDEEGDIPSEDSDPFLNDSDGGIYVKGGHYYVAGEQGDKHIMNARFKNVTVLRVPETEEISCISAILVHEGKSATLTLERDTFLSGNNLHRNVSLHGASFTGSDVHARYIYSHMLQESKGKGGTVYATAKEGLDVLCMPLSEIVEARTPFVVWCDASGVRLPQSLVDQGLDVRFAPEFGTLGIMQTDLAKAPKYPEWIVQEGNKEAMRDCLVGLVNCQDSVPLGKMIGWMVASFYTQLFRRLYGKFPLMHINGSAGSGKTEMTEAMMHLFYYQGEPVMQAAASSSEFAMHAALAGSASIPLILDEYKPHAMNPQRVEALKSMFRNNYNGSTVTKGGGNRNSSSFRALSQTRLLGPLVFIAEALETETAILERVVLVTLRRQGGARGIKARPFWDKFKSNKRCLSILGYYIAATLTNGYTLEKLSEEFEPIFSAAKAANMGMQEEDSTAPNRENINERVVYNHSVAEFGFKKFLGLLKALLPDEFEEHQLQLEALQTGIWQGLSSVVESAKPEFVKVLVDMSDMSRFPETNPFQLLHGRDFEFGNIGDTQTLRLVTRAVYYKYKAHCRQIGSQGFFANDTSFIHALRDSAVFLGTTEGTKTLKQEAIVLDYEALQRMQVPAFHKG